MRSEELALEPESLVLLMRRRWPRGPGDDVDVETPVELNAREQAWLCAYELRPSKWGRMHDVEHAE